jgi:hypothetical protein
MTQWLIDFSELLKSSHPVDDAQALGVLKRARSLHANPRTPWASVGFEWLQGLSMMGGRQDRAPEGRALQSLNWLLASGLPVEGAFFSVEGMPKDVAAKAMEEYSAVVRQSPRSNKKTAALYQGLPFSERGHPSVSTPWLGRTFWAGRLHPQLPELVDRWLAAGARPEDVLPNAHGKITNNAWSSWPGALMSGRVDALERLAAHGPLVRPPDWLRSVRNALLRVATNPEGVLGTVRWFVDQFPPTLEERDQLLQSLARSGSDAKAGLLAWVSIFPEGLSDAVRALGQSHSFNPWTLVFNPDSNLEALSLGVMDALRVHPVWGTQKGFESAWVKTRSLAEQHDVRMPLLDAVVLHDSKPGQRLRVERLLALADEWGIGVSPSFHARLAHAYDPPGEVATAWLNRRRPEWAGERPGSRSPWHAGVANGSVMAWLCKNQVSGAGLDERGNLGWGNALAFALRWHDDSVLARLSPILAAQPLGGSELGDGYSVSAWVGSRAKGVVPLNVGPALAFEQACVIMETLDVKAAANLFQAPGVWKGFSLEQQRELLDRWASARPPLGGKDAYLGSSDQWKASQRAQKVFALMVGETKALELGLSLEGWLHRVAHRHHADQDDWCPALRGRHDLMAAFDFMEGMDFLALPRQDQYVLARWLFNSIALQQGTQGPPTEEMVYPWSTKTSEKLSDQERAALARSFVHWLGPKDLSGALKYSSPDDIFYTMFFATTQSIVLDNRVRLSEGLSLDKMPAWKNRLEALPLRLLRWAQCWKSDATERLLDAQLPTVQPTRNKPRF